MDLLENGKLLIRPEIKFYNQHTPNYSQNYLEW